MPPFDCCGELKLFIRNADGEYAPFNGIETVTEIADPKYTLETIHPILNGGSLTATFNGKMAKKFRKCIHSAISRTRRNRRTYFRQKEKARRKKLKEKNHED